MHIWGKGRAAGQARLLSAITGRVESTFRRVVDNGFDEISVGKATCAPAALLHEDALRWTKPV